MTVVSAPHRRNLAGPAYPLNPYAVMTVSWARRLDAGTYPTGSALG